MTLLLLGLRDDKFRLITLKASIGQRVSRLQVTGSLTCGSVCEEHDKGGSVS